MNLISVNHELSAWKQHNTTRGEITIVATYSALCQILNSVVCEKHNTKISSLQCLLILLLTLHQEKQMCKFANLRCSIQKLIARNHRLLHCRLLIEQSAVPPKKFIYLLTRLVALFADLIIVFIQSLICNFVNYKIKQLNVINHQKNIITINI